MKAARALSQTSSGEADINLVRQWLGPCSSGDVQWLAAALPEAGPPAADAGLGCALLDPARAGGGGHDGVGRSALYVAAAAGRLGDSMLHNASSLSCSRPPLRHGAYLLMLLVCSLGSYPQLFLL